MITQKWDTRKIHYKHAAKKETNCDFFSTILNLIYGGSIERYFFASLFLHKPCVWNEHKTTPYILLYIWK